MQTFDCFKWATVSKIVSLVLLFISNVFTQVASREVTESAYSGSFRQDSVEQAHVGIHVGAGLTNGLRLGLSYLIDDQVSLESSAGYNVTTLGGATTRWVFSIGVNQHSLTRNPFSASFLVSYVRLPDDPFVRSWIISPSLGLLPFREPGIRAFVRAGLSLEFKRNASGSSTVLWPNVDIGVSWNIH